MTAFLDWISQHLTAAPLWIQSPIVITGAVVVCALIAVPLVRAIDLIENVILRVTGKRTTARESEH
jgi:hypothetical protein